MPGGMSLRSRHVATCCSMLRHVVACCGAMLDVAGRCGREIRAAIAGLHKGELIIKEQMSFALGMGSKYKKINVTQLI